MDIESIVGPIRERGFVVIEGALPVQSCRQMSARLEVLADQFANLHARAGNTAAVHGSGDARLVYNLHNKGPEFLELIFNQTVLGVARVLLSDGSYQSREPFQLALSQARGLYGAQAAQQLHIDSYIPGLPVTMVLQAGWALSDFARGSGATCFVPGSHRRDSFPENGREYDDVVEIEAPAGSLMLFSGSVWHGSSAKVDSGARWGVFNRYSRWFMRPSFDIAASTPAAVFDTLTDEQREILGFRFRAPKDEFTRVTRIAPVAEFEPGYSLPGPAVD